MATIVIVPGSFCLPVHYDDVVAALNKHGVDNIVVRTPSVGRRPEGPASMTDDARAIEAVTGTLKEAGKRVVLVAHSYGGIPATESLQNTKAENGAGVVKMVYLTALAPPVGMSTIDAMGGQLPPFLDMKDDYILHDVPALSRLCFSDISEEAGLALGEQMPNHSSPSYKEPLHYAGYQHVPLAYIFCEDDQIIPPEGQQAIIDFLNTQNSGGVDVHPIKAGHAVNNSQPQKLADILQQIAMSV